MVQGMWSAPQSTNNDKLSFCSITPIPKKITESIPLHLKTIAKLNNAKIQEIIVAQDMKIWASNRNHIKHAPVSCTLTRQKVANFNNNNALNQTNTPIRQR